MVLELASWVLMAAGGLFTMIGALGLVRMPELFTRMHAASVIDTLGAGLMLLGMMLAAGLSLVSLKLLFILGLLVFTGPVVTHALARAALHENIRPLLADDRRGVSRAEDGRGASRAEDGRGASRAEDDRGASRAEDGRGASRAEDRRGVSRAEDGCGSSRAEDDRRVSR